MLYTAFSGPREPSYNGRALSTWIEIFAQAESDEVMNQAAKAIELMGTNAYAYLQEWGDVRPPSAWKEPIRYWATRLPDALQCDWMLRGRHTRRAAYARSALTLFPGISVSAQVEHYVKTSLVRYLTNDPRAEIAYGTLGTLASVPGYALPTLTNSLQDGVGTGSN